MPKINVLSKEISQLIAAGEVVERPASVIKELVENSIDSGATFIEVEIKNGGSTFMRVTDNGCGIRKDDIKKAFLRHATSKVSNESDLTKISTLGFRGEALASISAVSRLTIITRTKDDDEGITYGINTSNSEITDIGCPKGTTILVEDLFFNTPARLKFLKKDISEANAIANIMDKIALSHPEIAIKLIRDGKEVLNTCGDTKLKSAIYSVYGRDFTSGLMEVDYEYEGITVKGFSSKPSYSRPNRNMQNFFINGRYIKSRTAMAAIEQAYKGSIMVGKFPSCVLHIKINNSMVDVNVHPAKIEVRFVNEKPLFEAVYHAIKSALLKKDTKKAMNITTNVNANVNNTIISEKLKEDISNASSLNKKEYKSNNSSINKTYMKENAYKDFIEVKEPMVNVITSTETNHISEDKNKDLEIFIPHKNVGINNSLQRNRCHDIQIENIENVNTNYKMEEMPKEKEQEQEKDIVKSIEEIDKTEKFQKIVGEAFESYIIIENGSDELMLIDKHAAHERLLYEKLKSDKSEKLVQMLLSPVVVTLEKNEYAVLLQNKEKLEEIGFEIDDFGSGKVIVRATPLEIDDIKGAIIEIAGYLLENKEDITPKEIDWLYHNIACRAAIKGGDTNSIEELIALANELKDNPQVRYCPHGRPIYMVISRKDIEKQFGRQ